MSWRLKQIRTVAATHMHVNLEDLFLTHTVQEFRMMGGYTEHLKRELSNLREVCVWRGVLAWDNTTCGKELSWESIGQFSPSGKTLC